MSSRRDESPYPLQRGRGGRTAKLVLFAAAAAGVVGLLLFAGTVRNGFVFDDPSIVADNPLAQDPWALRSIFTSHYWAGIFPVSDLYRPLTIWSFALNRVITGPGPAGYHLVNALLHGGVAALLTLLAAALGLRPGPALATGLLFAAHPVHVEAVAPVVGRSELLAALFALAAWLCHLAAHGRVLGGHPSAPAGREAPRSAGFRRAVIGAAGLLYAAALLSKEGAAVLPALILVADLATVRPGSRLGPRIRGLLPLVIIMILWLVLRWAVLPEIGEEDTAVSVFGGVDSWTRMRTAVGVLGRYLWLILFPVRLSADYSFNQIPLIASSLDPLFLGSAAAYLGLAVAGVALTVRGRLSGAGILIYLGALFPLSNIPFRTGTHMAERILYLPSVGICLLGPALLAESGSLRAHRGWRRGAAALLAVILCLYGARVIARNADWRDQYALFKATVVTSPNSAKAHFGLGTEEEARGNLDAAAASYRRALEIKPDLPEANQNLGLLLLHEGRVDEAIHYLTIATRADPDMPDCYNDLGVALMRRQRFSEAIAAFREEIRRRPGNHKAHLNLGTLLVNQNRHQDALPHLRQALAVTPENVYAQGMFVVALASLGRTEEAIAALDEAIRASPEFKGELVKFGRAALVLGLDRLARAVAIRARDLGLELHPELQALLP